MGLKVTSIIENGDLVPDKLTIDILENEVKKYNKQTVLFSMVFLEQLIKQKN